jgi:transcriptional regulator with XRE-family HTH domain
LQKSPEPADKHVGTRIRMRRLMLGISQEALGKVIGVTFQQLQKYEKGKNRISASRLQQIARALQVPIPFFFEGASEKSDSHGAKVSELFGTKEGIRLSRAFTRIEVPELRRKIVRLVQDLAKG